MSSIMPYFFETISRKFAYDLAVDLGTTNTVIFRRGSGIVVNQPSLLGIKETVYGTHCIVCGSDVKNLLFEPQYGRLVVRKPVQCGSIVDFAAAREMLVRYLGSLRPLFPKPLRVLVTVPFTATESRKRTIRMLFHSAGAREVYLIEEPRALAIGAGLDVADESAKMVVDIGGGVTGMAVLAAGKIVKACSVCAGGEHMDQAIARHVRKTHHLDIGEHAAEQLKIRLGDALKPREDASVLIKGRDRERRRTAAARVSAQEICSALSETVTTIIQAIKEFLKTLSPDQCVDVLDNGIALAGGSALLPNLDVRLERELVFPFRKVNDPLTCLAAGCGDALDYLHYFTQ